jgi:hypothetical protein
MSTIRLSGVTVNAPDAIALARFYAVITGGVAKGNSHWATVTRPHADIAFHRSTISARRYGRRAPYRCRCISTSSSTTSQQPGPRVLAAGATRSELQPNPDHCLVYSDAGRQDGGQAVRGGSAQPGVLIVSWTWPSVLTPLLLTRSNS